jgi:phosphate transport system protein
MLVHLTRDLTELKKEILMLGSMVEEAINKAIAALTDRRTDLGTEVIEGDRVIDEKEIMVEDHCLKILALHQPFASDLRFIIAVMKVNSYLERMGDLASNIAERAQYLSTHEPMPIPEQLQEMAEAVREMVHGSLDALVNADAEKAREVCKQDDRVDEIHSQLWQIMVDRMIENTSLIKRSINIVSAIYQLERIADMADNIAEDVVYMVEGKIIRHPGAPRPEPHEY